MSLRMTWSATTHGVTIRFHDSRSIARWLSELSPRTKVWVMIGGDALFLPLCMIASVAFRLGSIEAALDTALDVQLTLALLTLPVLGLAGLYRAVLRYIDLRVLVAASSALAAVVLLVFALALLFQVQLRAAFGAADLLVRRLCLRRDLALRRARAAAARAQASRASCAWPPRSTARATRACSLSRAMQFSTEYKPMCFLDDRRDLQGKTVAGLRVYSPENLPEAVFRHDVAQIVVAIPSASTAQKRRLIQRVEGAGLPVKILPEPVRDGRRPRRACLTSAKSTSPTCSAATRCRPTRPCSRATSPARWSWSPAPAARSAASCAARSCRSGQASWCCSTTRSSRCTPSTTSCGLRRLASRSSPAWARCSTRPCCAR